MPGGFYPAAVNWGFTRAGFSDIIYNEIIYDSRPLFYSFSARAGREERTTMNTSNSNINRLISALCDYADERGLITADDRPFAVNAIAEDMHLTDVCDIPGAVPNDGTPHDIRLERILDELCGIAAELGIIADTQSSRDNFDTRLMGHLTPRPGEVSRRFAEDMATSPELATDHFYAVSRDSNYIRAARVARDLRWSVPSPYGDIDISINMSKPEKDPRDIAAALNAPKSGYPACLLCHENVGFPGSATAPARQTLRQIVLPIGGERWFMQYSPYVYYNEHCIVLSPRHEPMRITHTTFERLLDFITALPHYFIGSNADLPIVGGSILTHDHMQGGRYEFPMARAEIKTSLRFADFPAVSAGILNWPMSVIRLRSADRGELASLACRILDMWRGYSDPAVGILAETDGVPHNTITPIARRRGEEFELDLVLRCNITSEQYPMGVFHPHPDKHNIKKENIGLIEVMGLAVLPSRLKAEAERLAELLVSGADVASDPICAKHAEWVARFAGNYPQPADREAAMSMLRAEIGRTFVGVLQDAGVFSEDADGHAAFLRFADRIGGRLH